MTQTKPTPGPCECGEKPTLHNLQGGDYQVICQCGRRGPFSQTRGSAVKPWNRQTAAPDLLAAAKLGVGCARKLVADGASTALHPQVIFDKITAAIALAEPKS